MGFPIRKSLDHSLIDNSPKLIAAFYVLHSLLMPRHPPNALFNYSQFIKSLSTFLFSMAVETNPKICSFFNRYFFFKYVKEHNF